MPKIKNPQDPSEFGKDGQGTPTRDAPETEEDGMDESIYESFPASDPPAL